MTNAELHFFESVPRVLREINSNLQALNKSMAEIKEIIHKLNEPEEPENEDEPVDDYPSFTL